MKENIGHHIFNGIVYSGIIAYILYINFAAYYNSTPKALDTITKVFSNWVFRFFYLLFVGFFALDIFKYGGFTFAILLTIAFLNSNMLIHKSNINESFENNLKQYLNSEEDTNNIEGLDQQNNIGSPLENISADNNINCGPYNNPNNKPFNPTAYRADYGSLGDSIPDSLPNESPYNGVFTQSSIGYDFNK